MNTVTLIVDEIPHIYKGEGNKACELAIDYCFQNGILPFEVTIGESSYFNHNGVTEKLTTPYVRMRLRLLQKEYNYAVTQAIINILKEIRCGKEIK